jgi:hypothetical protein
VSETYVYVARWVGKGGGGNIVTAEVWWTGGKSRESMCVSRDEWRKKIERSINVEHEQSQDS